MSKRYAIVLAAGQGTRMKSKLYKVLHPVLGHPMVEHVIRRVSTMKIDEMVTVVGHGAEEVKQQIGSKSKFVVQKEQLGTGHACMCVADLLQNQEGTTLVVCADTPLISSETYQSLFDYHEQSGAKATILTAKAPDPSGYGRVIRNESNEVERIVEHKDANEEERRVNEINAATYCFDNQALFRALKQVTNDNAQGEYYLPDVIEILRHQSEKVSAYQSADFEETIGVNDRVALAQAEKIMRRRINHAHMKNGVTMIDPEQTYIDPEVTIEQDVTIYPGSILSGSSVIKTNATIGPSSEIIDSYVGEDSAIEHSVIKHSRIGQRVAMGPYAHIRPEVSVGNDVKIGDFVEVKKAVIGDKSKIPHLSYVGDASIGRNVNVGCGTITVNYDGENKYLTTIEDDSFIGCNSNLIAPVAIEKGSYIAAGSTITNDVPEEALAIARARQVNKEQYAKKLKGKN